MSKLAYGIIKSEMLYGEQFKKGSTMEVGWNHNI